MYKVKISNAFVFVITIVLSSYTSSAFAQKYVASEAGSAGFRFDALAATSEPIIQYQQNTALLSDIADRPTFRVYGDGRVVVHNPLYMKKAGDYEMQLDDSELISLIRNLSSNGITDFDEKKVKASIRADENKSRAQGQFHEISDAQETVVDIRLDEYQKSTKDKIVKNFSKQFRWNNLEQDAKRYKNNTDITRAHNSVQKLHGLMNDGRLVHKRSQ